MTAATGGHDLVRIGELAGMPVVMSYGDPIGEYAALRTGAMLVDRSARGRTRVAGPKARELMGGLLTNDVATLAAGAGLYAAALTPKGKIVADVRVFAHDDHLLIDCPPRARAGWMEMMRKYVNPRVAPWSDVTSVLAQIGIFGRRARAILAAAGAADETLEALGPYAHRIQRLDGVSPTVARVPDLELDGFELFLPADARDAVWRQLVSLGATPGGLEAWEMARIESGRPEWGVDIDDSTIPQEANFDELHAISYTKGCYVGQETVARIHFRGHVNRHLRGLLAELPLPAHSQVIDQTDKVVGDVRSAAVSPRLGPLALGMIRREVAPGSTVLVRWENGGAEAGETAAQVVRLPFPS